MGGLAFDENWYLHQYKDVAESVQRGGWTSGYAHYCNVGAQKGRRPLPDVDADWYLNAYPFAVSEIARGKAIDASDHYRRFGRYRGYLPHKSALRPPDPACHASKFGGLWTDLANAHDLIDGRLDLGVIKVEQAVLLRKWVDEGYVILEGAISEPVIEAALAEVNRAYSGGIPDLRFQIHGVGQNQPWRKEAQTNPAKALDLHWLSEPVRDAIFPPKVVDFLHLIFERRALASQSLTFWRGSQQEGHQDSAYVNYSLPMQFAASWIALEDVTEGAGELFYHVGSHRMPDFLYADRWKGVEDAARSGANRKALEANIKTHIERIRSQAQGMALETRKLFAKKGDVLIWAADLAHGGSMISKDKTRKSVVTHYCPVDLAPSFFEMRAGHQIRDHRKAAWYCSSHY